MRQKAHDLRITSVLEAILDVRLPSIEEAIRETELRIEKIKAVCGQICQMSDVEGNLNQFGFVEMEKKFECKNLFDNGLHDHQGMNYTSLLPMHVPRTIMDEFTFKGNINEINYFDFIIETSF